MKKRHLCHCHRWLLQPQSLEMHSREKTTRATIYADDDGETGVTGGAAVAVAVVVVVATNSAADVVASSGTASSGLDASQIRASWGTEDERT